MNKPKLSRAPDNNTLALVIRKGIRGTAMPASPQFSEAEIEEVALYVRSLGRLPQRAVPGDPTTGESVYRRNGCANCHAIRGEGGILGPELDGIGERRSSMHLRQSLVEPDAELTDGYLPVRVRAANSNVITGIRVNENTFSIQFRDSVGRYYSFWKYELLELHKDYHKSPMPSYKDSLREAELTDLVAYLASLRENR